MIISAWINVCPVHPLIINWTICLTFPVKWQEKMSKSIHGTTHCYSSIWIDHYVNKCAKIYKTLKSHRFFWCINQINKVNDKHWNRIRLRKDAYVPAPKQQNKIPLIPLFCFMHTRFCCLWMRNILICRHTILIQWYD